MYNNSILINNILENENEDEDEDNSDDEVQTNEYSDRIHLDITLPKEWIEIEE